MNSRIFTPTEPIQWTQITLEGPDAPDFLHRLTTVDVRSLEVGSGAPGFFLTSQGRIRASFTLWRTAPNAFVFEFDSGEDTHWKKELLSAIDQYTFAEKMTLTATQPVVCRWVLGAEVSGLADRKTVSQEDVQVFHHGTRDFGFSWITVWGDAAQVGAWFEHYAQGATEITWDELNRARITQLRPWVGSEITESAVPLEIGMKDGIADQKGCYPGQEVIEKIVAIGSPSRRLVRLEGIHPAPKVGDIVFDLSAPPMEVGKLTSVSVEDSKYTALALVRKHFAKDGTPALLDPDGRVTGKIVGVADYK
jgi:folate-binding protein YgfZ